MGIRRLSVRLERHPVSNMGTATWDCPNPDCNVRVGPMMLASRLEIPEGAGEIRRYRCRSCAEIHEVELQR